MALRAKDLAEMLGVSTAAVSLVLNNKPGVGEKKRQEILDKVRELGCEYLLKEDVPLAGKGSIGFVVYKKNGRIIDESPFFTYILESLNRRVLQCGYELKFIYLNGKEPADEQRAKLIAGDFAGLIIFGVEMQRGDLQVFIDTGIPFSVLDNSFQESDVDSVAINNAQGVFKAVQYLYDMGHRRIGYIRCRVRINSFEERLLEYRLCMERLGLSADEDLILDASYSEDEIRADIDAYLDRCPQVPTAFFAENDFLACHAMLRFQERGYRFPDDISLIGFDDRQICQMVQPKLTTVNVPKDIFGPSAVDLLMSKLESGRRQSLKLEIGTNLILRDSVKQIGSTPDTASLPRRPSSSR